MSLNIWFRMTEAQAWGRLILCGSWGGGLGGANGDSGIHQQVARTVEGDAGKKPRKMKNEQQGSLAAAD